MSLVLITPPQPIWADTALAKKAMDVVAEGQDDLINLYLNSATRNVEEYTGRAMMIQELEERLPDWPLDNRNAEQPKGEPLLLSRRPVTEVISVKYDDASEVEQPYLTFKVSGLNADVGARLVPNESTYWPTVGYGLESVRVRYKAGYADAAAIPDPLKVCVLMLARDLYDNRPAQFAQVGLVQLAQNPRYGDLLQPFRVYA